MQGCDTKDCAHNWEEHADAWFVSGILLSSIEHATPSTWSYKVIRRGDSWILRPNVQAKFDQFRQIFHSMTTSKENMIAKDGQISPFSTQSMT
jgi:hypothetical protein